MSKSSYCEIFYEQVFTKSIFISYANYTFTKAIIFQNCEFKKTPKIIYLETYNNPLVQDHFLNRLYSN